MKKGSSHFTGKRRFDLQEEVVVVPVAIGHPLDDLDLVVHPLQHTGVYPVARTGDNPFYIACQASRKLLHWRKSATHGQMQPLPPASPGFGLRRGVPELLELILQEVNRHQGLVRLQQLLKFQDLVILEVAPVSEQEPATSLHYRSGRPVVPKLVGLIDSHPVNHLPTELGHYVE